MPSPKLPSRANSGLEERVEVSRTRVQVTSGPIPSPETLAQYERAVPGLAQRIVEAFEAEYRSRHHLEELALQGDIRAMELAHRDRRHGQQLGFGICVLAILCGSALVYCGHDAAGSVIGGAGLASVIASYYKSEAVARSQQVPSGPEKSN